MKIMFLSYLILIGNAYASPDDIHTCLAWFIVYEKSHPYDHKTSMLKTELEMEMKKDKVYNINQINEAMADGVAMESAKIDSRETKTTLSYCTKISSDFTR